MGFTLTFWSLQMGQHRNRASQAGGFADFWLGLARTAAMAIGELDIEQFSANFSLTDAEAGPAVISRTFALLLLSAFTITGTVALVSLLIASIVRDYKEMKAEVDLQNVQFMAQYIGRLEASLALLSWLLPSCVTNVVSYSFLSNLTMMISCTAHGHHHHHLTMIFMIIMKDTEHHLQHDEHL